MFHGKTLVALRKVKGFRKQRGWGTPGNAPSESKGRYGRRLTGTSPEREKGEKKSARHQPRRGNGKAPVLRVSGELRFSVLKGEFRRRRRGKLHFGLG